MASDNDDEQDGNKIGKRESCLISNNIEHIKIQKGSEVKK